MQINFTKTNHKSTCSNYYHFAPIKVCLSELYIIRDIEDRFTFKNVRLMSIFIGTS